MSCYNHLTVRYARFPVRIDGIVFRRTLWRILVPTILSK